MGKKYFVWSFDDGLEQDKRIVEILKQYRMGGTFHLNSGLFGDKTYEGRIGNLGITEMPAAKYEAKTRHLLPYVPHFRIPADEVKQVYEGFEIAAHTCRHVNLATCSEQTRQAEICEDVRALSELFGQPVVGFAYPYGIGAKQSRAALKAAGVLYARSSGSSKSFHFPADPLVTPLNGWHLSKNVFARLNAFFDAEAAEEDLFFLMFAHGYEFDFGTKESNWHKFERICETVARQDGIVCCAIGEALRQHKESSHG